MNQTSESASIWYIGLSLALLLILSLSCCESSEKATPTPGGGDGDAASSMNAEGVYPEDVVKAMARGKKENKITVVELYDKECPYCLQMNGTLKNKAVLGLMKDLVHVRITPEEEGMIEEFGLMESPTFMFFKPDGEYVEPFIQGFRSPGVFTAELANYKLMAEGKEGQPVPKDSHPDFGKG